LEGKRKKRRKVGPFSKRLSFAMLDLRTQEGRYARDICDGIAADLGGAPNAAQQITIAEGPRSTPSRRVRRSASTGC